MSKLGEGRTSNLIKRFENLSLGNGAGLNSSSQASADLRPAAKRIQSLSTAPWTQHAQPPASTSTTDKLSAVTTKEQPAQDVKFPVLDSTPPLVPATKAGAIPKKGSGASSQQWSDQLRRTELGGLSVSPLSPKGLPPTKYSSGSPMEDLLSVNASLYGAQSRSRASTTESALRVPAPQPTTQSRRRSIVTDLNQRAAINRTIKATTKSWLKSAELRIDEAKLHKEAGDLENAYVKYMMACNIVTEVIPKQRDFEATRKDPFYVKLRSELSRHVVPELENLRTELKQRPYPEPTQTAAEARSQPTATAETMTLEQVNEMENRFAQMYPEHLASISPSGLRPSPKPHSLTPTNSLGSSGAASSALDDSWLSAYQNKLKEIDAQARVIDSSGPQSHQTSISAISANSHGKARLSMATSPHLTSIGEETDSATGRNSEFVDANATTCTPTELWRLIERSRTGIHGRPKILILDVRVHQDFVWGRIDHRYVVNVDPIGLHDNCTSADVEASLLLVSEDQQEWFRQRGQFDLVVYVSESARSFSDSSNSQVRALSSLNSAIYHYEVDKPLRHPPLFLIGGFDAWQRIMGIEKCLWSEEARRSMMQPERKQQQQKWSLPAGSMQHAAPASPNTMASAANIASMLSYHTPTGSLSRMPASSITYQPASAATLPYNDMNGNNPSGSVFDFFQQNPTYSPQWSTTEARYLPAHTSFTQGYNAFSTAYAPPSTTLVHTTSYAVAASTSNIEAVLQPAISTATTQEPAGLSEPAALIAPQSVPLSGAEMAAPAAAAVPDKPLPLVPDKPSAGVQRRKTIFDNPTYGFTGSTHIEQPQGDFNTASQETWDSQSSAAAQQPQLVSRAQRRRSPPPVPLPRLPPKPTAYQQPAESSQPLADSAASDPSTKRTSVAPPSAPLPLPPQPAQQAAVVSSAAQQQQLQPGTSTARFYSNPVAAGSDPSLNGRMHAGGNLRSTTTLDQTLQTPSDQSTGAGGAASQAVQARMKMLAGDSVAYGATGLKNFGNTCFMNCVVQCLAGTTPFARYFLQGAWRKDLVRAKGTPMEVAIEFARLVDNMWRGQYGSLSPIGFRSAVGHCSMQFKANEQQDAQEFASFLLDSLHESLNRVHPRPPPDRDLTPSEEADFERLPDLEQSSLEWSKYIRRNWSIMTSIFQGQAQSRLTCLTCKHMSTTYATFTELSIPIPTPAPLSKSKSGTSGLLSRKGSGRGTAVTIYQCLDAYSETEILDGDDKWHCPKCKAKRRATKKLLISRLPLVLVVHLKRFSTIGHFREKLETNVQFSTQHLQMGSYVVPAARQAGAIANYNLYAVANHYGTLSGGHYTASVFNGLRGQWNYFDDTRVSPIAEEKVATPAAYLLFFVRSST
ncbi:hypothetical protein GQ54DRAFT_297726 [Martensiomyces pterosporus]|nr:hypothetical protein GQ54DRAFT_297726 [Martensiomyces pterosporus]